MRIFTLARVVYHFSVPLLSALPTEASVEQGPAEGLERRLKPSSITEAAAGGSAASQKDHMAHYSQNRDGAFRARAHVNRHLGLAIIKEGATSCCWLLEHSLLHLT